MLDRIRKSFYELASYIRSMRKSVLILLSAVDCTDTHDGVRAQYCKEVRGSLVRKDARQRGLARKPKKPP